MNIKNTVIPVLFAAFAAAAISCEQEPPVEFALDGNEFNVEATGGTCNVEVSSPGEWVATTNVPWITVSPANGKGSEMCSINATYLRQIEGGTKMPSLPVFIELCRVLQISPDYLLQDELDQNEISSIREIETLWQNASPDSQSLILAMIKAALDHLGQRGN